ncbi:protein of unknown function [Pararobbsia alpina]
MARRRLYRDHGDVAENPDSPDLRGSPAWSQRNKTSHIGKTGVSSHLLELPQEYWFIATIIVSIAGRCHVARNGLPG